MLLILKLIIMELVKVNELPFVEAESVVEKESSSDQFIRSNTTSIGYDLLKYQCIIPVFAKDNESTISHPEFIMAIQDAAQLWFKRERFLQPAVRVSHPIKGRIPEAMGKPADQLREDEKTIYWERMAFIIEIPSIRDTICGNDLSLMIGGVRAYNLENLHRGKSEERFKLFVGFKNSVCVNLCISTDGFRSEIRVRTVTELIASAYKLFSNFNSVKHLERIDQFKNFALTEKQFAQIIGRARMYHYLPLSQRKELPEIPISDSQISMITKGYFSDEYFGRDSSGGIDLYRLYNLFTGATKSSYIDTFLDRGVGSHVFIARLSEALKSGQNHWFLS
jgi:hypothetical protein